MNRLFAVGRASAITVLATLMAVGDAAASHPDILYNYRFIPSHSTLEVTGGFAGIEETFHPFGKFGLVTGYEEGYTCLAIGCPPAPTHVPYAEFLDVRSWLVPDGPRDFVWNTDETLNLSGLNGTFRMGEPNRLFFRGVDGQGQPFRLMAVQRGRLLHIMGENDPGCCDFFKYRFDAFAHLAPYADFNLDGRVDHDDMDRLLANIGTYGNATLEQGDADGDGDVDGNDFLTWQAEIGTATSLSAFASDTFVDAGFGAAAVPEPAALVLSIAGAMLLMSWYLRRPRLPIA